jgi:ribosomal protein S18 acetylase RimI-like enzyme
MKKIDFKTRKCKKDDYWFCYNLAKRNMEEYISKYWGGWDPKKYRQDFKKRNVNIIMHKGRRIGLYNYEKRPGHVFVVDMQISKNYQGKGIGTSILRRIEKEARKSDINKIRLEVFKDNPARKLYKTVGYTKIRDRKYSIVSEKSLKKSAAEKAQRPEC